MVRVDGEECSTCTACTANPPVEIPAFVAVERAGVAIATVITLRSAPMLVTVGERLITRRRTGRVTTAGIGLALIGLVTLVSAPAAAGPDVSVGAMFAGRSALGHATVTLVG